MRPALSRALTFVAILAASTTALATDKVESKDPNRIVCEKQPVLGSRLAHKRVCKTVAEWQVDRASDRQDIERTQVTRPTNGN
ncbi:MAG: hypothetical protein H0W65_04505 [Sphingomonas sp.]|uniref:hypothetical protein n=1 Tax=Sphingomonas sp. TaxID=28214 RepID=UPI00185DAE7D|nr:hypothetical protein [Sphingomonas sp.]MBA3666967.1 hypothetical protein [Sphingomonas sp.]